MVYIQQPKILDNDCKKVCKLQKYSYNLKKSGRLRNGIIDNELLKMSFIECEAGHCSHVYIADILVRFGSNCNPTLTPIDYNQKSSTSMCPKYEKSKWHMPNIPYMVAKWCLLFARQISRPSIHYGKSHWEAVKRVMSY